MNVHLVLKSSRNSRLKTIRGRGPALIVNAQNRAAKSAITAIARPVAQDTRLKVGVVKDAIRLEKASVSLPVARIFADAKRIPLIDFGATGPVPSRGKGKGVRARTPAGRYPHAFIAQVYGKGGGGGHIGVFERRGKGRLPIRELFGPSIAHVVAKHVDVGRARYQEQLHKNLQHNFRYFTEQSQES